MLPTLLDALRQQQEPTVLPILVAILPSAHKPLQELLIILRLLSLHRVRLLLLVAILLLPISLLLWVRPLLLTCVVLLPLLLLMVLYPLPVARLHKQEPLLLWMPAITHQQLRE